MAMGLRRWMKRRKHWAFKRDFWSKSCPSPKNREIRSFSLLRNNAGEAAWLQFKNITVAGSIRRMERRMLVEALQLGFGEAAFVVFDAGGAAFLKPLARGNRIALAQVFHANVIPGAGFLFVVPTFLRGGNEFLFADFA